MTADLKGTQINLYKESGQNNKLRSVQVFLFFSPGILAEILQTLQQERKQDILFSPERHEKGRSYYNNWWIREKYC